MLNTLRWARAAANANSLTDPNATFDPTLPCVSGEEAVRDALEGVGIVDPRSAGVDE